jgi:hypothetical protein
MTKRKKGKSEQYLTNVDLMPELLRAKRLNRITPELGRMFILITDRYSTHPWFCSYSPGWIEEMRQEAIVALVRGALKFDPTFAEKQGKNPNGFSYLTTITYRSFKSTRDKLKKNSNLDDILPPGLF